MSDKILKKRKISEFQNLLQESTEILGDKEQDFEGFSAFFEPKKGSLTFLSRDFVSHLSEIYEHPASVILCDKSFEINPSKLKDKAVLKLKDPRKAFSVIVNSTNLNTQERGIHPTALIHDSVTLGKNVFIGPHVIIEKNCKVGENTIIKGNNYLFESTSIGKNVIINPGAVIGKDGFGYVRDSSNELTKFPHFGKVTIEDDVEIGCNTVIDRGALMNTVIGKGSKIDNLVHVAHHVEIGENCMLASVSTMCGGAVLKDNIFVGPGVTVSNNIIVENNAHLTLGSTVVKDVGEGKRMTGYFSLEHKKYILQHRKIRDLWKKKK